jgi:hypothetical protein
MTSTPEQNSDCTFPIMHKNMSNGTFLISSGIPNFSQKLSSVRDEYKLHSFYIPPTHPRQRGGRERRRRR